MSNSPSLAASGAQRSRTDRPAILLVEDDDDLRTVISELLTESGYAVSHAGDHRRALEVIEAGGPLDLLMTDLVFPNGISGFTLGRMARVRRPRLKVLYFTGYDIPADRRDHVSPILQKPLTPAPLLAAIGGLLQ